MSKDLTLKLFLNKYNYACECIQLLIYEVHLLRIGRCILKVQTAGQRFASILE